MLISLKKELYKLQHKKKYAIILILGLLILVGRYGIGALVSKISGGTVSLRTNMPMEILPMLTDLLVPIVIFMAVTDLFSAQIQEDTFKADLMRPVTRAGLLFSKISAIIIMGAVYLMIFFIAAVTVQGISGGGIRLGAQSFAAYAVDIIPMINIALLAAIINLLVEGPALSMFLCLAVYAVLKYLSFYNGKVGPLLFTSYSRWHNLFLGTPVPLGSLLGKCGIIFGTMLIFASVSYIILDEKSI